MAQLQSCFFVFLFLISYKIFAYTPSEGKVSAIIGPYLYKTNFEGSSSGAKSPVLSGVSLIAEGDLNKNGGLEVGLFYMNKLFFRQSNGLYIAEKTEVMHVTMGYRYWISSYFSAALAFYSAYSIGIPQIEHSDFATGTNIDTSARDTTEYGFDLSLQSEIWNFSNFSLVMDARYAISATSKQNEEANHYGLILGLRYTVQEKIPENKRRPQSSKK